MPNYILLYIGNFFPNKTHHKWVKISMEKNFADKCSINNSSFIPFFSVTYLVSCSNSTFTTFEPEVLSKWGLEYPLF